MPSRASSEVTARASFCPLARFCRNLDACAAAANLVVVPGSARSSPQGRPSPSAEADSAGGEPCAADSEGPEDSTGPEDSRGPEIWLALAINAETAAEKRERALRGLEVNQQNGGDAEFECLLLRQLFLAEFEEEHYDAALDIAERMIAIGELADVARQDAARACLALGDASAAAGHLRIAARICPPSRRPFHDWTLGALLYLDGQWGAAAGALSRAARWATTQKPLYEAQLGLAQHAAKIASPDLEALRRTLEGSPCATGYGELVLGELCFVLGDEAAARRHLEGFVTRVESGRPAKAATLRAELSHARALLTSLGP